MKKEKRTEAVKAAREAAIAASRAEIEALMAQSTSSHTRGALGYALWSLGRPKSQKRDRARAAEYQKHRTDKHEQQAQTLKTAGNKGMRWTDEHDAVVLNTDLTDVQVAQKISRTLHAVRCRRFTLARRAEK